MHDTDQHASPGAKLLRSCIQRVATGPDYSKDLSFDETRDATAYILTGQADPVQAAVFFIGLRLKRETDAENRGALQAVLDATERVTAAVDELIDLADPYDGFTRSLPMSPFLPAVLAACGLPAVTHGVDCVGPKFGTTHRHILAAAGVPVDLSPTQAAARLSQAEIGWTYIDQRSFCPALHALTDLRARMIKRPVLTTVEVLANPIRGRSRTHYCTGYVHKPYPPVYLSLARQAGFDAAFTVRGIEGGIIPSLKQPSEAHGYHAPSDTEQATALEPSALGISQETRAVPLPSDLPAAAPRADGAQPDVDTAAAAEAAAAKGRAALAGEAGPALDALIYGAAICLQQLGRVDSLNAGAEQAREAIFSGQARARFEAAAAAA